MTFYVADIPGGYTIFTVVNGVEMEVTITSDNFDFELTERDPYECGECYCMSHDTIRAAYLDYLQQTRRCA